MKPTPRILAGLMLLLLRPGLDLELRNNPTHFWLVVIVSVLAVLLGLVMGEAARKRRDLRVFLVSLAFIASAGFLALHALATPGVLLAGPNAGFDVAMPIGLFVGSCFAAASGCFNPIHRTPLPGARSTVMPSRATHSYCPKRDFRRSTA